MNHRQQNQCGFSPITIHYRASQGRTATWSLQSERLPRLLDCRARLVWRYAGENTWRDDLMTLPALSGTRLEETLHAGPTTLRLAVRKGSNDRWEFSGRLANTGDRPIELARFHYLDGVVEHSNDVVMLTLVNNQDGNQYCFRQGQEVPAVRPPPAMRRSGMFCSAMSDGCRM